MVGLMGTIFPHRVLAGLRHSLRRSCCSPAMRLFLCTTWCNSFIFLRNVSIFFFLLLFPSGCFFRPMSSPRSLVPMANPSRRVDKTARFVSIVSGLEEPPFRCALFLSSHRYYPAIFRFVFDILMGPKLSLLSIERVFVLYHALTPCCSQRSGIPKASARTMPSCRATLM